MLSKGPASKKSNGIKYAGSQEKDMRIGELIGDDLWQSSGDKPDGILVPSYVDANYLRKTEIQQSVKLLMSSDDSNKKHILGTSSSHNKERRKVLLVEQPGQKTAAKNTQVKVVPANRPRPITADEIQRAKMRARFMQCNRTKSEGQKKHSLLTNDLLSASEAYLRPKLEAQKLEAQKKARVLLPKNTKPVDCPPDLKATLDQEELLLDKCWRVQIPWWTPPEIQINEAWEVGTGQNSKEIEVQKNRMIREKETINQALQEVPPNPKDPWDREIDFDDTLTPEIPIEQLPDSDGPDSPMEPHSSENQTLRVNPSDPSPTLLPQASNLAEPDLELLAVLLKNPELVFALTSGQASGLSGEDTVKLLDMLKASGGAALLNAKPEEKAVEMSVSLPSPTPRNVEVSLPSLTPPNRFEVSLPSPTPSCDRGPSGWQAEAAKNLFSRQTTTLHPGVTTAAVTVSIHQNTSSSQSYFPTIPSISSASHQILPQTPISVQQPLSSLIPENLSSFYKSTPAQNFPTNHHPATKERERLQRHPQHPFSEPYPVHEDNMNRAILNVRHGYSLTQNSPFSSQLNQNAYNPSVSHGRASVSMPGLSRGERDDLYPEISLAGYPPPEHHHQGHEWNISDQRGRNGPPDRLGGHQNSPVYRDCTWHGGYRRR